MSQYITLPRALSLPLFLIVALVTIDVQAAESSPAPVQLALVNPIQVVDSEQSVRGFRYSLIWGVNQDVSGLDISTIASSASGDVQGAQWALFLSHVGGHVKGLQMSGLSIATEGLTGLQVGLLGADSREGSMRGVQLGLLLGSYSRKISGVQISMIGNSADHVRGIQVAGLLNFAGDMKGLQIGLLNFNKNGFLPFFPLFNFGS